MDSTNKLLLAMTMISLLVSAGGTFLLINKIQLIAVTGRATPVTQGNATFTLTGQAVVNVSQPTIDWGNVAVSQGNDSCIINSETGTSDRCSTCSGTPCTVANSGFIFHNIGSVNINVSIAAGKTAASFIGGSIAGGPAYLWKARNKTAVTGWVTNIISTYSTTSTGATLAYFNMSATNTTSTEEAYLDLNITIPRDAPKGAKTDTLTFTAVETMP